MRRSAIGAAVQTAILLVSAAISIAIAVAGIFGAPPLDQMQLSLAILGLLGVIAFSLGVERAVDQRQLREQFGRVEKLIAAQVGGRLLTGEPEIYTMPIQAVSRATKPILTLIYGKIPRATAEFALAVARRLAETKKAGAPITFDVIFAVKAGHAPGGFIEGVESRLKFFDDLGVKDQVRLRVLECGDAIGFDTLIVDAGTVNIAFPLVEGGTNVQIAIFFEGCEDLGSYLARWFQEILWAKATPYELWLTAARRRKAV